MARLSAHTATTWAIHQMPTGWAAGQAYRSRRPFRATSAAFRLMGAGAGRKRARLPTGGGPEALARADHKLASACAGQLINYSLTSRERRARMRAKLRWPLSRPAPEASRCGQWGRAAGREQVRRIRRLPSSADCEPEVWPRSVAVEAIDHVARRANEGWRHQGGAREPREPSGLARAERGRHSGALIIHYFHLSMGQARNGREWAAANRVRRP